MPHSGYRTQTDIAVSTGAVQDAYRALNKLERGWAHEDYDVSPLHLHHRVYGHHHGHHIEPYGASHVSRAGLPWGITPRKGRRRHHSRHHLGDHTYGGRTFRRAYSLPPSRPLSYGRLVEQRIESSYSPSARSDYTLPPAVSLSQLRSRTLAARDKLDLARSMYDRYIPAESGAPEDVRASIEGRVGALLTRLDSEAHYHKDRSESNTPLVRPYEPLSISRKATFASSPHVTNSYLRNVEFKMPKKISETRKRAREALCKAKKDPHYYD